jgi:UDP-N-acetylglucosamine 2-epimerase
VGDESVLSMSRKPKLLVVTYGGGHSAMLLPVALSVQQHNLADVIVLGLTTAAAEVKKAGLPLLQYKDLTYLQNAQTKKWGRLLRGMLSKQASIDDEESEAYLGINFAEMVDAHGLEQAEILYQRDGRQGFLPTKSMLAVLKHTKPDLLLISNSPRSELAAGSAAQLLGINCVCINALFAIDEIEWLKNPFFANSICVLNQNVKEFLCSQGRLPEQVFVTGNPSFDALHDSQNLEKGSRYRQQLQEKLQNHCKFVILWASQPEPLTHPTAPNRIGNTDLPLHILQHLKNWVKKQKDAVLIVRPHPSERAAITQEIGTVVCPSNELPIAAVLYACDLVVTMTSTVGVEAWSLGKKVIQVKGSIFDHALPMAEMGLAEACSLDSLLETVHKAYSASIATGEFAQMAVSPQKSNLISSSATDQVVKVLREYLK